MLFASLYPIDSTVFRWVNTGSANDVFDAVMPFVTEPRNPFLYVPLLLLFCYAVWRYRSHALWCGLVIAVTVTATDQLNSRVIKNMVGRERPCRALPAVHLLMPCGGGMSFPSSHAANIVAAACVVGYFFRRAIPVAALLALLVVYSRVYVGVHYPADVLGGALVGAVIALCTLSMWRWGSGRMRRPGPA
jgi:undecaprenyl-diphosphatase